MLVEFFFGMFLIACFVAAVCDFLVFKLPNAILLFIILLFVLKVLLFQSINDFIWPSVAFVGVLCVGFFMYRLKWIGAGDAKFIATASLWASQINLAFFLLMMSIAGGVLALAYLKYNPQIFALQQKLLEQFRNISYFEKVMVASKSSKTDDNKHKTNIVIPYGIAVFIGVLSLLFI
jgi:Flp pilus assembly protein protease CpaA